MPDCAPFSFPSNDFPKKSKRAFSLVEVVFAIGVMTFSALILLGLLPNGIKTIQRAISTTVQAEIMQNIVSSAEIETYTSNGVFTNSTGASPAVYYFDDQGTLLANTPSNYIYKATVTTKALTLPGSTAPVQMGGSGGVPGVASLLQVVITSVNEPNTAATNTVIWPNTGT